MSLYLDRSGWERLSLGTVATASREKVNPSDGTVDRYVAGEHMDSDDLKIHRWGDSNETDLGPAFHRRFRPGQVLYGSRRTYLRKVAVADFDGVCANTTFVVQTMDPTRLIPEFLPFVMSAEPFHAFAVAESKGSVNPYVNWSDIMRYEFDLPPLDEQKRIADLLWAVQRDSTTRATALAAVDALIDLWMRDVGQIDGAEAVVVSDLIEHSIGGVWGTDPGTSELDVAVIRGTDITIGGKIRPAGAPARSIKESEAKSRTLTSGDVLVEKSGGSPDQPVGKVGLVRELAGEMVPSNFVLLLRPDRSRCEPTFLFSLLRGMWRHGGFAEFTGKTTNIANLRTKELLASTVRVPSREVQRRLATEFDALERTRTEASSAVTASAALLTSLTAEVFGGTDGAV